MTDSIAPLTDEEISAALDGQADASVVERLGADPRAQARYRELQGARDLVASESVAPLDGTTVDSLIARALAAADEVGTGDPSTDADGGVVAPITFARSTRRSGPPLWAVAAVVAALVAVGVGLVWSGRDTGGGGETAAVPTTSASVGEVDESDTASLDPAAPHGETTPPTVRPDPGVPAPILDIGEFESDDELRSFLADSIPTAGSLTDPDIAPTTQSVKRCADQVAIIMGAEGIGSSPVRRAFVHVGGEPFLAYEFELVEPTDEATTLISVVDPASCNPSFTFLR